MSIMSSPPANWPKCSRKVRSDLRYMPEEEFDNPLGMSTGAGVIFGSTGGVLEAALRTVSELYTGKKLEDVNFVAVRGTAGIREAEVQINGRTVRVAALSGLGNARKVLEKIVKGEEHYDVIEIMACPGGCVNGGGQPYYAQPRRSGRAARARAVPDRPQPAHPQIARESFHPAVVPGVSGRTRQSPGA
jgi:iron only hydrogenase large subunit-like protein